MAGPRKKTKPKTGRRAKTDTPDAGKPFGNRRVLTDEEREERRRVVEERHELRRREAAALEAIAPACVAEDDPPVAFARPMQAIDPAGVLLRIPRLSGAGLPGSELVLCARSYDGMNKSPTPRTYALAMVLFRNGNGALRRTVGCSFYSDEIRAVIAALTKYADALGLPP